MQPTDWTDPTQPTNAELAAYLAADEDALDLWTPIGTDLADLIRDEANGRYGHA